MTADAPLPDPSLPPPMDAVGGADALAEGGMLTLAGADDGAAAAPFARCRAGRRPMGR